MFELYKSSFKNGSGFGKAIKICIRSTQRRITGRTDKPRGIKAGAHKLSHFVYQMCKNGWQYFEKGGNYYEKMYTEKCIKNLRRKAKEFGFMLVAA